jgi:hypothetical protein
MAVMNIPYGDPNTANGLISRKSGFLMLAIILIKAKDARGRN